MKTNSVADLLKAKGIGVEEKSTPVEASFFQHKRKRLYQDIPAETKEILNGKLNDYSREVAVSSALDRREADVSSALDSALDRREVAVSSALDRKNTANEPVSSALDIPLVRREVAVSYSENSALEINALVGKEKTLVLFIASECKKIGNLETNYIGTEDLKALLVIDSLGLRNLIFRVKVKGFISVTSKQLGRVGLRKFKISKQIYQQFNLMALDRREAFVSSALDKPLDKPLDSSPSKLVSNLKTNLVTSETFQISDVDLSPVQSFKITSKHLNDIKNQNLRLTQHQIQDLITRFALYASNPQNLRGLKDLPAYFVKLAQRIHSGENPLEFVETAEDKRIAELLDMKRNSVILRAQQEEELLKFEFDDWFEQLSDEEKRSYVPSQIVKENTEIFDKMLLSYFRENIWPSRKLKMLES